MANDSRVNTAPRILNEMRSEILRMLEEVSAWDLESYNGFNEDQNLKLGNLCAEFSELESRFNSALESFNWKFNRSLQRFIPAKHWKV